MNLINAEPVTIKALNRWTPQSIENAKGRLVKKGILTEQEMKELIDQQDSSQPRVPFQAHLLKEFTDSRRNLANPYTPSPSYDVLCGILAIHGYHGRRYFIMDSVNYEKVKAPSLLDEKPKKKEAVPGPNGFLL
jgi:hypothetical protein